MIRLILCASVRDEVRIVRDLSATKNEQIHISRRCADLSETLAAASAADGDVVLIDVRTRGLRREHLQRMREQVAVVVLTDEAGRTSESTAVVSVHASTGELIDALVHAVNVHVAGNHWEQAAPEPVAHTPEFGRMVTVWGPAGAPGRSFVAANLAAEAARHGIHTLLVDADTFAPSLAQMLGVLDNSPGLVAACRSQQHPDAQPIAWEQITDSINTRFTLLSGIGVPARWVEVRAQALNAVWSQAKQRWPLIIVDASGSLIPETSAISDGAAEDRNGAVLSALRNADDVLAVVTADPVSITRLLREKDQLTALSEGNVQVAVNRVGPPTDATQIRELISERIPVRSLHTLPDDAPTCRRAAWAGETLAEAAPRSPLRTGIASIAKAFADAASAQAFHAHEPQREYAMPNTGSAPAAQPSHAFQSAPPGSYAAPPSPPAAAHSYDPAGMRSA